MRRAIFELEARHQIRSLGRAIEIIEVRYRKKAAARRIRLHSAALDWAPVTIKMNVSLVSYHRRKAAVEHSIGNGEVDSSILSGSTSFSLEKPL
jgi:hypothetical protein